MTFHILIGIALILHFASFHKVISVVTDEGAIKYTDRLTMLAEALFFTTVLTCVGFWQEINIPTVLVAFVLVSSVLTSVKSVFFGEDVDFKVLFEKHDAAITKSVKGAVVLIGLCCQIIFFFLLWSGGLFSL